MTDACTLEYKGVKYVFQNTLEEPVHIFIDRCWFIAKMSERYSNKNDNDKLEALSHAYVNVKHLGVGYDKKYIQQI